MNWRMDSGQFNEVGWWVKLEEMENEFKAIQQGRLVSKASLGKYGGP